MEPKRGDKYSGSFLRDAGKVQNKDFYQLGGLGQDLVSGMGLVLQILGAAPSTCMQQPPRVRGHLLICGVVWEGGHQHLQSRSLNMGAWKNVL